MPVHRFRWLLSGWFVLASPMPFAAAQDAPPATQETPAAAEVSGTNPLRLPGADRPSPPPPSLAAAFPASTRTKRLASREEKLGFAGGIALLAVTDQSTLRWFDSDRFREEARAGDSRTSSDLASGLPLLAGIAIPYLVDGRYGRQSARLALGATLNALVVVQPMKMAFGRERPDQALSGSQLHGPSARYDSFPSGHTAIAFGIATVYAKRYRRWRVPIYLLATGVGLSRVDSGRHYLSDVFAGAGIGILAGRASLRGGGRLLSWRF